MISLEREQRQHQTISAFVSVITFALMLILSYFLVIMREMTPPPDEPLYEVVGRIDFGNYVEGGGKVNNFRDPKPNATSDEPVQAKASAQPAAEETPITQTEEAEVKAPTHVPEPARKVAPPSNNTKPSNTKSESGGSNHGDKPGQTGNRGAPAAPVLDPQGLYSFGTGEGEGLMGRSLLSAERPKYDAQEEGKLKFQITINPKGQVVNVKTLNYAGQRALKQATETALRKWKFSPIGGAQNQNVTVTFTFKLK